MMEMPTPCPGCGEIVEFDDMIGCRTCNYLFCRDCIGKDRVCGNCEDEGDTE